MDAGEYFLSVLGKNPVHHTCFKIILTGKSSYENTNRYIIMEDTNRRIEVEYYFNFNDFFMLETNTLQRCYLISLIHKVLNIYYINNNLNGSDLKIAYQKIIDSGCNFEWNFKNKYFKVDNYNYITLTYNSDYKKYKIYEILYDNKKNEKNRRCIFMDYIPLFKIEQVVMNEDGTFSYKFKGPNKIFKSSVDQIINGHNINDYVDTSKYFK